MAQALQTHKVRILSITFLLLSFIGHSQDVSVEDRIVGINFGLLNVNLYSEWKINTKTTFRGELGIQYGFSYTSPPNDFNQAIIPSFTIQTRRYYNLDKRQFKNKITENNSGAFWALDASFFSQSLSWTNDNRSVLYNDINEVLIVMPLWGLRQQGRKHFIYEIAAGGGLGLDFERDINSFFAWRLMGRIGFIIN